MVEDAAGLDYIKDMVAKRAEEIIFHAEWEKSVLKSHELLVQYELKVFGCLPVLKVKLSVFNLINLHAQP